MKTATGSQRRQTKLRSQPAPVPEPDYGSALQGTINQDSVGKIPATPQTPPPSSRAKLRFKHESVAERLAAILDLVTRMKSQSSLQSACQQFVDLVAQYLECSHVAIAACGSQGECRLIAAATGATRTDSEDERFAQSLLQETVFHQRQVSWPPAHEEQRIAMLAHQQFAEHTRTESVVSGPLYDGTGKLQGAWLVAGDREHLDQAEVLGFLRAASVPLAATLNVLQKTELTRRIEAIKTVMERVKQRPLRNALIALAVGVGLFAVPLPYQVDCDCVLEPTAKRLLAAPFAAPLDVALVRPGDLVQEGQVLAKLDGQENRWELEGSQAELHRAQKERAGHVAKHEFGKAEVARHEVERLKLRTQLLQRRDDSLEIRCPIAGLIVSGDWREDQGVPLKVGERLFEVAPLDEMVVEIGVPEDQIDFIQVGAKTKVVLDAFPWQPHEATVERIHPRAELRDQQNVFVAELRIENTEGRFRPGMHGNATISAGQAPLAWSWLRKPLTTVAQWLGW